MKTRDFRGIVMMPAIHPMALRPGFVKQVGIEANGMPKQLTCLLSTATAKGFPD
jgi:hypothetical protein